MSCEQHSNRLVGSKPTKWRDSDNYLVRDRNCETIKLRLEELHRECQTNNKCKPEDLANWINYFLYMAASHGSEGVCKYLLTEQGANPTVKYTKGQSAIHNAARCGQVRVLKLFADNRWSLDESDDSGYSPSAWAQRHNQQQCVQFQQQWHQPKRWFNEKNKKTTQSGKNAATITSKNDVKSHKVNETLENQGNVHCTASGAAQLLTRANGGSSSDSTFMNRDDFEMKVLSGSWCNSNSTMQCWPDIIEISSEH
ncbi:ankyrin repeat domain-containing protein 18B-like [Corticium candelabrum]|uniref:ankyrin repeat domain-containing protein 18B-like n=1 Tax=Corticium candelabrum TaxID=121492 RepID=UPI002E25524F|nr:ankyrin repeat domain-containing protein 18B-like [Corticium candelabrum]